MSPTTDRSHANLPGAVACAWPLHGRAAELDRVLTGLTHARSRGAAVEGAPGQGVSRLLGEVDRRIADSGRHSTHLVVTPGRGLAALEALTGPAADDRAAEAALARAELDVLIVDDAHLLNGEAAEVLRRTAAAGTCRLVLGTHPHPAAAAPLEWLRDSATVVGCDLRSLDQPTMAALLYEVLGEPVSWDTGATLGQVSGGNPGALVDLVRTSLVEGTLIHRNRMWRLEGPPRLSDRFCHRVDVALDRLGGSALEALDLLVLAGRLPLASWSNTVDPGTPDRLEHEDLVAIGRKPRMGGDPLTTPLVVTVADPIVAAARRQTIGPTRAARLAERLLTLPDTDPAQRARWLLLTGEEPSAEEWTAAATAAFFGGDLELAATLARSAADGDVRARNLLGDVLIEQGQPGEAAKVHGQVLDDPSVTPELWGLSAMARSSLLLWHLGRPADAVDLAARVADLAADGPLAHETAAFHAAQLLFAGRAGEAVDIAEPLIATARGRGLAEACMVAGAALTVTGACERGAEVAALGVATRDGLGDQLFLAGPDLHHVTRAFALVEGGRIPAAAEVAAAGRATATAGGTVANSSWLALVSARVALAAGQIPEAELRARTAATGFAEWDLPGPLRLALAAELLGAAWRNDREQAAALDHTLLGFGDPGLGFLEPDVVRARAWAQAAAGDLATAGDLLDRAATLAADTGQWTLRSSALHDRVRLGDAAAVVGALQELVGRVDGRLTAIRARHAAALAGDDPDELLTVSSAFAHFGAALLAAEAATQAAAAWRRAGRRHRSEEARRIAAELRRRCPEASTPALRALLLADLSPREREVCTLAETDRTSREIAGQLGISVRTVDNLLHRAYAKLRVDNRHGLRDALG